MRKLKLLLTATALLLLGGISVNAQDAGTYYIQNVSNDKWLAPGNNWSTQASVLNHADYWKLAKISDGVYTLESVVSNGGTSYYLNGTYCDGGATNFTFTAVDGKANTYTIANASGGLLTTNGTTVDVSGTDAAAVASQWKLWSTSDMTKGMAAATVENPFDATYLIKDHDLGRNNRDYSAWSNTNATAPKSSGDFQGATVFSIEAYCKTFDVKQTLSGIPNGVYAVRVNGFYRQDGSNANLPYVYANDSKTTLPVRTGTENNMQDAAVSFVAGNYLSDPAYVQVTDGSLTIGVKTEGNSCWTIFKNFHLAYYGNVTVAEVLLAEYVKAYNEALTEAQAFTEGSMFAQAWSALQDAISDNTLDLNNVTQEQLETATANLRAANTAATTAVKAKTCYDSAVTLINGGTNVDLTSIVENASFEDGNLNGWTTVNGGAPANNNNWAKDGTWYVERWTPNGDNQNHLTDGTLTHDALVLPAGLYTITAKAQNQEQKNGVAGTGYFLYANDEKVEITGTNEYSTSVLLSTDKSELVIKFALEGCTGNWISCDNIRLTYVGEDFPEYTLVTGKMNADVAAAQTAADEAFQASKTVANYNTLTAAIANAQASKDAYAAAATAIENANALKEAHNFASAAAYTTFAEAITAIETPYTNNTLSTSDANAAGTTLGTVITGWHAGANGAAVKYMNDGFSLNDFDAALYINTWSNEGETDGSNFKVPFYEYFAGEGSALGENTWTGQLSGLENGLYSVSAWVRVRSKNAETSAKDLYGISMDVNKGTAVDVTEGDTVAVNEGYGRFQHKVYTTEGLVKDGILNVNFNIAADNNIHWLSFKNIKYTKVRDLTPEEAAVVPADLSIDATKTVFKGKTVTLTPTSTTESASIDGYLSWESDDENVATVENGVVTGVGYGTVNITVTSTLNAEATATCAVTVTAPLITEAENLDFSEGPTVTDGITIRTYAKDKTGSDVSGMQEVSGWTIDSNGDAKAAGIVEYGSNIGMGAASSCYAPATDPEGNAGNVLGMVGVWSGSVQYIQSVKLPAGYYTIEVPVYMTKVTNANELTKNLIGVILDDGTEYLASTKTYTNGAWKTETISFTVAEETYGKLSLGLINPNTGSANSQRLYIDGVTVTYEPFASPDDYADLNSAIEAKDNKILGFQEGEYAPYNNVAVLEALAAAKAIDQTANNPQSTVQNATATLTAATWNAANTAEVNAFFDGSFEYDYSGQEGNVQPLGWYRVEGTYSGDGYNVRYVTIPEGVTGNTSNHGLFGKFTMMYGAETGYSLPLKAGVYSLTFNYGGWNEKGSRIIKVYNAGNEAQVLPVSTVTAADNTGDKTASSWRAFSAKIVVPADGDYIFSFYRENTSSQNQLVLTDLKMFSVPETNVKMAVSNAKYGTFIAPFDVTIPEGVEAYTIDGTEGNTLTLTEVWTTIKANTPVLLFSENVVNENKAGYSIATNDTYTEGLLTGVYAPTLAPVGSYVLQNHDDKVGFYRVADGKEPTVGANRAYLTVSTEAREAFFFGDDQTTAIHALKALTEGNAEIYDVNGVRQNTLVKGMNIVKMSDGSIRKVMVK